MANAKILEQKQVVIDEIKENLSGYMVDIFIDGERYSALEIV